MLKLRYSGPKSLASNPNAKRVPFSQNDSIETLKANSCAVVGVKRHYGLRCASPT